MSGEKNVPKYVIKQCRMLANIYDGENDKYIINEDKVELIDNVLKLMIMPKGLQSGSTVYETLVGFQFYLIISALCIVHRSDTQKRRFTKVVLEICRKNGKTFLIAVIMILLFLLEPKFSKFYSVAPDGKLSREIKDMIEQIIKSSPVLIERFKIRRDDILCKLTENDYIPLNYSNSRLDGKLPSAFVADEVGALPNSYAVEAMESGQLTIKNKLGCVISTKYPKIDNPFEAEVDYCKKVLDNLVEDETIFSLLYEPDDTKNWEWNDEILIHANPLACEVEEIMEDIKRKRQVALEKPSARENFVTKHCNIVYQGVGTESYIDVETLKKGRIREGELDWFGRDVFLGLDLAMTTDNCSLAMITEIDGVVYSKTVAFIPEDRIDAKNKLERIDYREFINDGTCFACGDLVVDYGFIESVILEVEQKHGVNVIQLGYDRYNCISTAQKLEEAGIDTVEVKQVSAVLHRPTKWLEELILQGNFKYEENKLLEINFQNAKCNYDSNLNKFVNKKKSTGKIDMVISNIIALTLLQIYLDSNMTWTIQEI